MSTTILLGADFSAHQLPAMTDPSALMREGLVFAFMRATIGERYTDPTWGEHTRKFRRAGLPFVGAYHVLRGDVPAREQAEHFVSTTEAEGDIIPAVDAERLDGLGEAEFVDVLSEFVCCIERKLGRPPVLYSFVFFLFDLALPAELARCPLWIADYRPRVAPEIPAPWAADAYETGGAIWQFDGTGGRRMPSGADADFNRYRGTTDDFAKFIGGVTT